MSGTKTTAAEVEKYLKAHPSFLAERPHLLAPNDAGVRPDPRFQQKQLAAMREREDAQRTRMQRIIHSAESNQQLELSLHNLSVALLAADRSEAVKLSRAIDAVRRHFDVRHVRILLLHEPPPDGVDLSLLKQRVAHLGSVCDDRVASGLRAALFPKDGARIASCAFIPLVVNEALCGVMVLGDAAAERFHPDMGVLILDRLGQLVGAWLNE